MVSLPPSLLSPNWEYLPPSLLPSLPSLERVGYEGATFSFSSRCQLGWFPSLLPFSPQTPQTGNTSLPPSLPSLKMVGCEGATFSFSSRYKVQGRSACPHAGIKTPDTTPQHSTAIDNKGSQYRRCQSLHLNMSCQLLHVHVHQNAPHLYVHVHVQFIPIQNTLHLNVYHTHHSNTRHLHPYKYTAPKCTCTPHTHTHTHTAHTPYTHLSHQVR